MKNITALLTLLLTSYISTYAQTPKLDPHAKQEIIIIKDLEPSSERIKYWNEEKGMYLFSVAWTWEQTTNGADKKEVTVFVDPQTGTMLFVPASAGYQDEMTEWIMAKDTAYWHAYTDENGRNLIHIIPYSDLTYSTDREVDSIFKERLTYTGEMEIFAENKYGWKSVVGEEYEMIFEMSADTSMTYLTSVPFSARPLYLFDRISDDYQLPIRLDYADILPADVMIVGESYDMYGVNSEMKLVSISHDSYHLDISDYTFVKR